ncbi:MAG: hypothetical protein Q9217_000101 [Psora testacea]
MILLPLVYLCVFTITTYGRRLPALYVTRQFDFDDLSIPQTGLASVPDPYHNLKFTSFSVFKPQSPSFSHRISPYDLNCAVSAPNALLGSRAYEGGPAASFGIGNDTAMHEEGLEPSFTLRSLMVKPMAAPEPGTNLIIRGYRDGKDDLTWSVWFPSGYHLPFEVRIAEFSGVKWEKLEKVEVVADFGYDRLDWEFCVDDIVVEFTKSNESGYANVGQTGPGAWKGQIVLQDG